MASTRTVPAVWPRSTPQGEKTISSQPCLEMPCLRCHHAEAMPKGRETAHTTVVTTMPVTMPEFTGPSPSERASRGARRTITTRVVSVARVPRSQL